MKNAHVCEDISDGACGVHCCLKRAITTTMDTTMAIVELSSSPPPPPPPPLPEGSMIDGVGDAVPLVTDADVAVADPMTPPVLA